MSDIDWSKAPEGATHHVWGSTFPWEKRVGDNWRYFDSDNEEWIHLQSDGDDRINQSPTYLPIFERPKTLDTATPSEWDESTMTDNVNHPKQLRYMDSEGRDWIDECAETMTPEEFRGAMKFTIGKYLRRAGKKDALESEITKIEDYARRWLDYEKHNS